MKGHVRLLQLKAWLAIQGLRLASQALPLARIDKLITGKGSAIGVAVRLDAWHMRSSNFDTTATYIYFGTEGKRKLWAKIV
ncbi:hypothetical protein M9H77_24559 [Catharanthus roseus]|uniref:Uncharacterized protein n=1 Tax=Catharanthus roseus TaxID=4058 RepID=A0ACC0B0B3_CATRO|nr:hypothetical protein M9H77_24559 [Catharanthus roseus]